MKVGHKLQFVWLSIDDNILPLGRFPSSHVSQLLALGWPKNRGFGEWYQLRWSLGGGDVAGCRSCMIACHVPMLCSARFHMIKSRWTRVLGRYLELRRGYDLLPIRVKSPLVSKSGYFAISPIAKITFLAFGSLTRMYSSTRMLPSSSSSNPADLNRSVLGFAPTPSTTQSHTIVSPPLRTTPPTVDASCSKKSWYTSRQLSCADPFCQR